MDRTYRWTSLEGPGLEHLHLRVDGQVRADGMIIGERFGQPCALRYRILCDAQWRVRELDVDGVDGAGLLLRADGAGNWADGTGAPIPALAGAIDVDIAASAFTNTLPLRRLGAALARRTPIDVVYVAVPELSYTRAPQAYTRIAARRVLYEGLDSGYQAELEVDADGLVVRYPELFERL